MPKEEWGVKRICPTTGKRFYDLNKTPVVSPYTGEVVEIENANRSASVAPSRAAKQETKNKKQSEDTSADPAEELLDDDSSSSSSDADLLEDDDDNVALDDLTDVSDSEDDG